MEDLNNRKQPAIRAYNSQPPKKHLCTPVECIKNIQVKLGNTRAKKIQCINVPSLNSNTIGVG